MNIFNKNDVEPYSYLVIPNDFEITNTPQIIFAPNGAGKTTLFNILTRQNSDNCELYTYDESVEPTYKTIDGKKKKIIINPLSPLYSKEASIKAIESKNLDAEDSLYILYSGKNKKEMKNVTNSLSLKNVINSCICDIYDPLNKNDREKLIYILPYFEDIKNAISSRDKLFALSNKEKETEIDSIKYDDRKCIYTAYDIESHKLDIEKDGCPLCGNKNKTVYAEIKRIKEEVENKKISFFKGYDFIRHLPQNINQIDAINLTIEGLKSLSEEKMLFLLLTHGQSTNESQLKLSIERYKSASFNMSKYINERDQAYNRMRYSKNMIEKYFPTIYPSSKVIFDDSSKSIEIVTDRNMTTYSEGEKHEMYSLIRELSIIGSHKEIVIADDPLTEFDVANEYKNVFRFVKLANENNKKVIIFTCNPNFINIANEYHPTLFKRYYLQSHQDVSDKKLELKLLEIDFKDNQGKGPYISLTQAIDLNSPNINNQIVNLINIRSINDISHNNPNVSSDISKLFHYDSTYSFTLDNGTIITNDQLFDVINNFSALPKYSTFTELARDRVYYLAALRVYLEKQLYLYQQERINKGLRDCFPSGKHYLTKDKILIVDKISDEFKIIDKFPKWNRSTLMCLKTILNDNDHAFSQILPISYAISLTNDSLESEIQLIKDMFS